MTQQTALILSGGGARGAYQAGVLKGVSEILADKKDRPFDIISGVSAGAINGVKLASEVGSFSNAVEKLVFLWSQMTTHQVFKADFLSLNSFASLKLFGSSQKKFDSLLDTAPLRDFLIKNCNFNGVKANIESGNLNALVITANSYTNGAAVSFVQSKSTKGFWKESRRLAQDTQINVDHILASSAIPMLFPPIKIGPQYYGDGCVRNHTPCSPSIRLGAEKLFVIGVRTQLSSEVTSLKSDSHILNNQSPSIVRIFNTLLNAVLLDSVEQDVYRIQRINQLVDLSKVESQAQGFKKIPALCISPSQDIGEIARHHAHHLPRLIRMTISAMGSLDEAGELLSYLLFEPHFCQKLIEMGYEDALNSKEKIEEFFLT